jgi:arylsulfatase A-like enzyme
VVVLGCTVRRDQLTPYGGHPDATPTLAALAHAGTRFDDAIAAAPWTKAASTALLNGRHAVTVGMVEPGKNRTHRVLGTTVPTLAQRLHRRGWQTVGSTANPNLNAAFGLSRGFEHWHDSLGAVHEDHRSGHDIVTEALQRLDAARDDRPLYLQVMLTDAHDPRRPSSADKAPFEGTEPKRLRTYQATLHALDRAVGTLRSGLAERGYNDGNTYFVFVADHGEGLSLPAHHRKAHGMTLYPSIVRVPWLVTGPGVAVDHVVDGVASGVDLLPTLLDLLDLPTEDSLPGESWAAQLRGADRTTRDRAWSDSWFRETSRASVWTSTRQCQLDFGSGRVAADTHEDGCFDRAADPDFHEPIADEALLTELRAWRAARQPGDGDDATLDPAVVDQLRALGYAD